MLTKTILKSVVGVASIFACVVAGQNEKVNQYVDELLEDVKNDPLVASKIEPIHVPDIKEQNFEGSNIYIRGFSSLQRDEKSNVSIREGKDIVINLSLKAMGIKFNMDYKAKGRVIPISIRGKAEGKVDKVSVDTTMSISPFDGVGKLEKFKVTHFGHFRVNKVTGATIAFNWLMRIITNRLLRRSKNMIIEGIEDGVASLLNEKLSEAKISARRFNRQ